MCINVFTIGTYSGAGGLIAYEATRDLISKRERVKSLCQFIPPKLNQSDITLLLKRFPLVYADTRIEEHQELSYELLRASTVAASDPQTKWFGQDIEQLRSDDEFYKSFILDVRSYQLSLIQDLVLRFDFNRKGGGDAFDVCFNEAIVGHRSCDDDNQYRTFVNLVVIDGMLSELMPVLTSNVISASVIEDIANASSLNPITSFGSTYHLREIIASIPLGTCISWSWVSSIVAVGLGLNDAEFRRAVRASLDEKESQCHRLYLSSSISNVSSSSVQ